LLVLQDLHSNIHFIPSHDPNSEGKTNTRVFLGGKLPANGGLYFDSDALLHLNASSDHHVIFINYILLNSKMTTSSIFIQIFFLN